MSTVIPSEPTAAAAWAALSTDLDSASWPPHEADSAETTSSEI